MLITDSFGSTQFINSLTAIIIIVVVIVIIHWSAIIAIIYLVFSIHSFIYSTDEKYAKKVLDTRDGINNKTSLMKLTFQEGK